MIDRCEPLYLVCLCIYVCMWYVAIMLCIWITSFSASPSIPLFAIGSSIHGLFSFIIWELLTGFAEKKISTRSESLRYYGEVSLAYFGLAMMMWRYYYKDCYCYVLKL